MSITDRRYAVAVLGPLRVEAGNQLLTPPGPGPRMLLGLLCLTPGEQIAADHLVELLWGPERGNQATLHTTVYRLRGWLRDQVAGRIMVERVADGYRLDADGCELDTVRFRGLLAEAGRNSGPDRAALLAQALDLWRGPVLGAAANWLYDAPAVVALERARLTAALDLADLCLSTGAPALAVSQLRRLVDTHPFDEPLHAVLIRALAAGGATADAVRLYERLRTRLADELGIDPSPDLRRLHQELLASTDPGPAATTAPAPALPVPRQLPAPPREFTGREDEVAAFRAALRERADGQPPLVAVDGMAGVGKSALALHVGNRVARSFPDGQLYVNLRGAAGGAPPVEPYVVLANWLRQFGVPGGEVPAQPDDASALWRTLLADRRVLLVLDDAVGAEQVRPLLPAGPGCATLVTSRAVLSTLDCSWFVRLRPMPTGDAVALLDRLVGDQRVPADPDAAREVADLCEHLPLLLRIVAARLIARPSWTVRAVADRLHAEHRRLDELQVDNLSVRASLEVGLRDAGAEAEALFPYLGLLGTPESDLALAASLAGTPLPAAEAAVHRLVDARLVDAPAPRHFRLHDVIRLYARDRAATRLDDTEQRAALRRAVAHYLALADQARRLLDPNEPVHLPVGPVPDHPVGHVLRDRADATGWIDANAAHLADVLVELAAQPDLDPDRVRLALLAYPALAVRDHWPDMIRLDREAVRAAQRAGRPDLEALARNHLGMAYGQTNQLDNSLEEFRAALRLWETLGDQHQTAKVLNNLGILTRMRGDLEESSRYLDRCIPLFRAVADRNNEARALHNLGLVVRRLGRHTEAVVACEQAVAIFRVLGDEYRLGLALGDLAAAVRSAGRAGDAVPTYQESLAVVRACGNRLGEAEQLWGLGETWHALGDVPAARSHWQAALEVLRDLGSITGDEVRAILAEPVPTAPAVIRNST